MPPESIEQFPPLIQLLLYVGVMIVGGVVWLVGGRRKHGGDEDDRLAAIERELASRNERERTDRDLAEMRKTIEENLREVVKATRIALEKQIEELRRQNVVILKRLRLLMRKKPAP